MRQGCVHDQPKGVSDDEERDILVLGVPQDFVAVGFNHLAVGNRY